MWRLAELDLDVIGLLHDCYNYRNNSNIIDISNRLQSQSTLRQLMTVGYCFIMTNVHHLKSLFYVFNDALEGLQAKDNPIRQIEAGHCILTLVERCAAC